jgi:hypothetical protein
MLFFLQPPPKVVKGAPGKKKPSINTQTLDKYRLVKRLPVNRMLKAVTKVKKNI